MMNKRIYKLIVILCFVLLSFPALAHAEVMDKEVPLINIILWTLVLSLFGFYCSRFHFLFCLLFIPISFLLPAAVIKEIRDPFVGPAIIEEAGILYILTAYASPIILVCSNIAGIVCYFRRKRKSV